VKNALTSDEKIDVDMSPKWEEKWMENIDICTKKTKNKQETCFSEAQRYPYGNVAKDPRLTQGTLEFKRWRKS